MAADILAGLGLFKSLYDSAKALKDINDGAVRNSAVIELQEKILAAREAQSACLEHINELEKELACFETWETEKQRYEMKTTSRGSVVYSLKADAKPAEPPHLVCANCYQTGRKSFLQKMAYGVARSASGLPPMLICHACKAEIVE